MPHRPDQSEFPVIDTERPPRRRRRRHRRHRPVRYLLPKRWATFLLACFIRSPRVFSQEREQGDPRRELGRLSRTFVPPWVYSLFVHAGILFLLGLLLIPIPRETMIRLTLQLEKIPIDAQGISLQTQGNPDGESDAVDTAEAKATDPVDDPSSSPVQQINPVAAPVLQAVEQRDAPPFPAYFTGRNPGNRDARLKLGGGGEGTEGAVLAGLHWLVKNQRIDGSWSLTGPYADGISKARADDNPIAATTMALLAFQGFGVTPHERDQAFAPFLKATTLGWSWLLKQQGDDGCFSREGVGGYTHRFYVHGMATTALCELYGMSGREEYWQPAQAAVDYCIHTQDKSGGWRYYAEPDRRESDCSVTGWVLQALQAARAAGLSVPRQTLERIGHFYDTVSREDGSRYVYQNKKGEAASPAMTAKGLLGRELLGWKRDDPRLLRGLDWLLEPENRIRFDAAKYRDCYYWYHATQAFYLHGGERWEQWNETMRTELPRHQERQGKEAGSWSPYRPVPDCWGAASAGRLFTTCLSIYMLEIYYNAPGDPAAPWRDAEQAIPASF